VAGLFLHVSGASVAINKTLDGASIREYARFQQADSHYELQLVSQANRRQKGDHCSMRNAIRVSAHLPVNLFWKKSPSRRIRPWLVAAVSALIALLVATPLRAQQDPWDEAVQVLQTAFTGTIAKGLSLVAIVVGGLMFAFGEGQSKRALAGIIFGVGMAIGAVNFMAWLFP
jgi:type IV secretion system protein TrbC